MTTVELLAAHPFLAGLTQAQFEQLAIHGQGEILHGGKRIFDEGGRADRWWLIIEGRVRLDTHVPGRGDVTVQTLGGGDVLGWSWLFEPYRWHFSATASQLTPAIGLDGPGVRRLCLADPVLGNDLNRRLTRVVVDRLQQTRLRLLDAYGRADS